MGRHTEHLRYLQLERLDMKTYDTDKVIARMQTNEGRAVMDAWDSHWEEVMKLAEWYGFIVEAYGGVATLGTNEEQCEQLGLERKAAMLNASGLAGQVMGDE